MNETEKRIIQLIDEHREELIAMGNELYTRCLLYTSKIKRILLQPTTIFPPGRKTHIHI